MDHHAHLHTSENRRPFEGLASHRVMARHRDCRVSLVRLAENSLQAAHWARAACNPHRSNDGCDDIVAVRTEEWVGTLTTGEWRPTSRWQSVLPRRFAAGGTVGKPATTGSEAGCSGRPRTGDTIECVLLAEKTRKGGWRARLTTREVVGPVTNSGDMPATAQAGQLVKLRVGAISQNGQRIQFHWPAAGNSSDR